LGNITDRWDGFGNQEFTFVNAMCWA